MTCNTDITNILTSSRINKRTGALSSCYHCWRRILSLKRAMKSRYTDAVAVYVTDAFPLSPKNSGEKPQTEYSYAAICFFADLEMMPIIFFFRLHWTRAISQCLKWIINSNSMFYWKLCFIAILSFASVISSLLARYSFVSSLPQFVDFLVISCGNCWICGMNGISYQLTSSGRTLKPGFKTQACLEIK